MSDGLVRLGASGATVPQVVAALEEHGHVVLEGALPPDAVAAAKADLAPLLAEAPFGDTSFLGRRTRRLFALLAKVRSLDAAALHPLLLGAADQLLGHHHLSSTVAIEIHPGEVAQTLHTDESAWPVPPGGPSLVVNSIWALDDFTEENGATLVLPGSHRWPADRRPAGESPVPATMPAGSAIVYLGRLWHAGGANRSGAPRLGVVLELTASWLRQQENLMATCPPDLARQLPDRLAELIGYDLRPPFVGHVDGRDPKELLR